MSEQEWIDIFGDNLRDILQDAKMTQRELADAIGVEESTISRYIHKERMPSLKTAINMAYALDCDISEFIDFGDTIH